MTFVGYLRSHLNLKVFLSFAIVIIVCVIVLLTAVEFIMPSAFENHIDFMKIALHDPTRTETALNDDLFSSFRNAVYNALKFAVPSALIAATIISISFSRQFVHPIRKMLTASEKISDGNYSERIPVQDNQTPDDLDELGRLAIGFNQMTTRLEHNEELRRELIADVSHEIRTPLAFVRASVEGLLEGIIPCSNENFLEIQAEIDRLNRLVNDLLELSKLESGEFPIDLKPTRISQVIEPITIQMKSRLEEKHIQLSTQIDENLPLAALDKDRIKQVLYNILSNAIQFTPINGHIQIIANQQDKQSIRVAVRDSGIGIPGDQLRNIFKRFYRVDKSRSRESGGSGIGLTVSKQLVAAHGGTIWAESEGKNMGTTIYFTLPISK